MVLRRRDALRGLLAAPLSPIAATGCTSIGPTQLDRDQLDYTRVVADSSKRQTLFNLVRMRFGDAPAFVSINQLVSGYTVQGTAQGNLQTFPSAAPSSFWSLLFGLQYTDRPTFTLNPMSGEQFAEAYLRPFAPANVVPLIQGDVPVDMLFRLVVQSVGPLQNTHPMAGARRSGSPDFLPMLASLRTLQEGGALRIRIHREREGVRAFIAFDTTHAPELRGLVDRIYARLGVDPAAREVEIVYGQARDRPRSREIPILTRSLLNVLSAVAAEIEVSERDVREGRTRPTLREPGAPRPMVVVRSGPSQPSESYAAVRIADRWYWVDSTDFESKAAFSILELLKTVAESRRDQIAPVLTIPTG
jgi:hypothetical protein